MSLNKAVLAASIIVAAVAIFFAYSQFNDLRDIGSKVPLVKDLVQTGANGRGSVDDSAFKVGQISTVEASDSEMTLPDLFQHVEKSV
ncbi:MAG TPA: trypsin, partial [Nitrososphaera sp.]|nr:trypsin [Nitrososphaera sp.]